MARTDKLYRRRNSNLTRRKTIESEKGDERKKRGKEEGKVSTGGTGGTMRVKAACRTILKEITRVSRIEKEKEHLIERSRKA